MNKITLLTSFLLLLAMISLLASCGGKNTEDASSEQESTQVDQKSAGDKKNIVSPSPTPSSLLGSVQPENEPSPEADPKLPKVKLESINLMNMAIDKGYSSEASLSMNINVSFPGYIQDLPLSMEGYVLDSQDFSGVMEVDQNDRKETTEVISIQNNTYALYHGHAAWQQVPSLNRTINPPTLIDVIRRNLEESSIVGDKSTKIPGQTHVRSSISSSVLGELIPLLRASTGILTVDLFIDDESGYLLKLAVDGNAKSGPNTKGPNGEDLNVRFTADLELSEFGKKSAVVAPKLPPEPVSMQWQLPPDMTINIDKDYKATITVFGRGDIVVDLLEKEAPMTVNNFIFLAEQGYYDGVTFHRVIPGFMAQSGDPTGTGSGGPGYMFNNELHPNARHDVPGILSMANSGMSNGSGTNGSQFFITYSEQSRLDGLNVDGLEKDCSTPGVSCHSVFGRVIEGMDVLDTISPRDPQYAGSLRGDVIAEVVITSD
jgi:cyclophilin family peptidyl-prolyl cis-trans isomerase